MTHAATIPHGLLDELAAWDENDGPEYFPYEAVMSCFRRHGKHFAPEPLLRRLASVRRSLAPAAGARRDRAPLDDFLAVALDKWDGTYTYSSYLGLGLFGLTPEADAATGRRQRERWFGPLLADLRAFELGARDGTHDRLPERRPDAALTRKRLALLDAALSAATPPDPDPAGPPRDPARTAAALLAGAPDDLLLRLSLSIQPVFVVHDEYMFIRVLQAFEVTFAAMAAEMRDAVAAAARDDAENAAAGIVRCAETLSAVRGLFSLLATMKPDSFQIFRAYTVGASAIQSEAYKTFETYCSAPSPRRLESPAYGEVPRVRDRVEAGWSDVSSLIKDSMIRRAIDEHEITLVREAAAELERVHQRWKRTHWKMASRMIGAEVGTGYTEGVPYLRDALDNRLFTGPLASDDPGAPHA
ncbi:hypothetical protein OG320_19760 [Microbispora sp. NBC_01189]|uniref:hypothetical protein n=1 Tax=Microbispora sp. NBC_01189 TaxID=2903583 RepID=UPI002E13EDB2|nr:hypothetical protein OG320_19760 [Microbispora sp. NBC_01189]